MGLMWRPKQRVRVGKLLFSISQDWLHTQADLGTFPPAEGDRSEVRSDEAGNVNKERACFSVTAG